MFLPCTPVTSRNRCDTFGEAAADPKAAVITLESGFSTFEQATTRQDGRPATRCYVQLSCMASLAAKVTAVYSMIWPLLFSVRNCGMTRNVIAERNLVLRCRHVLATS